MTDTEDIITGSASDGRTSLVNSIAPEPLKEFEPKCTLIFSTKGPRTVQVCKVMDSKVKVIDTFDGEGIPTDGLPSTSS